MNSALANLRVSLFCLIKSEENKYIKLTMSFWLNDKGTSNLIKATNSNLRYQRRNEENKYIIFNCIQVLSFKGPLLISRKTIDKSFKLFIVILGV